MAPVLHFSALEDPASMAYPAIKRLEQQAKVGLREGVPEGREMVANGVRSEERTETPDHVAQMDCAPEAAREARPTKDTDHRIPPSHL